MPKGWTFRINVAPDELDYWVEASLDALARRQHSVLTRHQIVQATSGYRFRAMLRDGEIIRLRRSIYRTAGAVESWEQAMLATVLAAPDGGLASGLAAGRIWGLPHCRSASTEVTVPLTASYRLPNADVHRSAVPPSQQTVRNFIPVMSLERTVISLTPHLTEKQMGKVLDHCIDVWKLQPERILDALEAIGRRGRPRISLLVPPLLDRLGTERTESWLERRTLRWLKRNNFQHYTRQYSVAVPRKKHPYRLDFAWPDLLVGVEPEGYQVHVGSRSAFDDGHERRNAVLAMGWRIMQVNVNTDETVFIEELRSVLLRAAS